MSPSLNQPPFRQKLSPKELDEILETIEETGFYSCDEFIDSFAVAFWKEFAEMHANQDHFRDSTIGKNGFEKKNSDIRSDKIFWIDSFTGTTEPLGDWLMSLATELKNHFRMPVDDIEAHFSVYPSGSRYQKHIDNATGQSNRMFTFIFYLNPEWKSGDGGELVVYDAEDPNLPMTQVAPRGGTFVLFRSDLFHHEVLPAHVPRYAFTGWLRRGRPRQHARV